MVERCYYAQLNHEYFNLEVMCLMLFGSEVVVMDSGVGDVAQFHDECEELTPDIYAARLALLAFKSNYGQCRTMRGWLLGELVPECAAVTTEISLLITNYMPELAAEQARSAPLLLDLHPFKNLNGFEGAGPSRVRDDETVAEFEARLRTDFTAITQRLESGLVLPLNVPTLCTDSTAQLAILEQLKKDLEDAFTFNNWMRISLEKCCEDTYDATVTLLIPRAEMATGNLLSTREDLYAALFFLQQRTDATGTPIDQATFDAAKEE